MPQNTDHSGNHSSGTNATKTGGTRIRSTRIRQDIGIFAAVAAYYMIHEGAHLFTALYYGVFRGINFMGLGMQIDVYAEPMTQTQLGIFCLAGAGFIRNLWADANGHFAEVAHLAKKDETGNLVGIWGAMTDFSRELFSPRWRNTLHFAFSRDKMR